MDEDRKEIIESKLRRFKSDSDRVRDKIVIARDKRAKLERKLKKHKLKNMIEMRKKRQILVKRKLALMDKAETLLQEISNGLNSIGY